MSRVKNKGVTIGSLVLVLLCVGALILWLASGHMAAKSSGNTAKPGVFTSGSHTEASWAFPFVKWEGRTYVITSEKVQTVGKWLGTVTNSSDEETSEETGTFSNISPVGTKLYEVAGVDAAKEIAVEQGQATFVLAKVKDSR